MYRKSRARYARVLSYPMARLGCPFLEARGNPEDASTTLSAYSRGYDCEDVERAVSNVPTWVDCRNTGKRLNERIVASSGGGVCDRHAGG